ncbi:hypothetical protein M0804_008894 [Polistes exclamans]|nr:hypothetical protein M0804_008894 [Polistes exclamans]
MSDNAMLITFQVINQSAKVHKMAKTELLCPINNVKASSMTEDVLESRNCTIHEVSTKQVTNQPTKQPTNQPTKLATLKEEEEEVEEEEVSGAIILTMLRRSRARLPSLRIPGVHIRENRLRKYARFMHQYRAPPPPPPSPPPPPPSTLPSSSSSSSLLVDFFLLFLYGSIKFLFKDYNENADDDDDDDDDDNDDNDDNDDDNVTRVDH